MKYLFETSEFGLSQEAFHLLRSRYNFKTYSVQEIDALTVENGKQINNWVLVLVILLIAFTAFYIVKLFFFMTGESSHTIYIEQIVIPVLPLYRNLLRVRFTKNRAGDQSTTQER